MAAEETEDTPEVVEEKSGGLVKTLGIAIGLFILMLASQLAGPIIACKFLPDMMPNCGAGMVADGDKKAKDKQEEEKGPPTYFAMDPPMVVSFEDEDAIRFLQVTVEIMSRDEESIQAFQTHTPLIRNNLLMLMGGKSVGELTSRDGKEALRQESLTEVKSILEANTGKPGIEDLYFTSFVVQ